MPKKLSHVRPIETAGSQARNRVSGCDPIETLQLARLASTVLDKSKADIAALAEANPALIWEWIEAFGRRKAAAEAEARLWSAAMAYLATSAPGTLPAAAE
jgi:hypothetical protein